MNRKFTMGFPMVMGLLCLCLIGIQELKSETLDVSHLSNNKEKKSLLELIRQWEMKYDVLFSYDRSIVESVDVDVPEKELGSIDDILELALEKTDLKYTILENRYVVLYKNDAGGIQSLENMIEHLNRIIESEKKSLARKKTAVIQQLETVNQWEPLVQKQIVFNISGQVMNKNGEPLIGVNVLVKGSDIGTATDFDGNFMLSDIDENAILVFSYIGYQSQEIAVARKSEIRITLLEDSQTLDEIVVVGYGTQKKRDLTGSVASITNEKLENRAVTNLSQVLSGQMTGITLTQNSGEPGRDEASVRIRGVGTFGSGLSPLVVIDGIPGGSLNDVDPNNIESLSVLKDASASAIYGARAANGVILISTKRGREGKTTISYNGYVGMQRPTAVPKMVDSWVFAELYNEALKNTGQQVRFTPEDISKMRNDEVPFSNTDHVKNLFESGTGLQFSNNLSFLGGTDKSKYSIFTSYLNQDGLVDQNSFKQYNIQLNYDHKISDKLSFDANVLAVNRTISEPIASAGTASNFEGRGTSVKELYKAASFLPVYFPEKYEDGTYSRFNYYSVRAWLDSDSYGISKRKRYLGNFGLKLDLAKGLNVNGRFGYIHNNNRDKYFNAVFQFSPDIIDSPAKLREYFSSSEVVTLQSNVEYKNIFNEHEFHLLGGYSEETSKSEDLFAYREGFSDNNLTVLNAGGPDGRTNGGGFSEWAIRSFYARFKYDFGDKYLFEANARYDGSSRFRKGLKYGFFPSLSAAWILSEEGFFKKNWITNLKIRGSWGELGNQNNVGRYPYQETLSVGDGYIFGNDYQEGVALTTLSNRDVSWETARMIDIGVDVSAFNSNLNLSIDYFNKITYDILYRVDASKVLGLASSLQNIGSVLNRGWEITSSYSDRLGDFNYHVMVNFSTLHNEVLKLSDEINEVITLVESDYSTILRVGDPMNAFYGYKSDGLFVSEKDIENYAVQNRFVKPGDVRNVDLSGPNGFPDGKVDPENDRTVLGSQFPKYTFGLNLSIQYKKFDLNILMQGHSKVNGILKRHLTVPFTRDNLQDWQTDRWTHENPNRWATVPRYTLENRTNWRQATGFWILDASYLRIKDIQIGYSLPKLMLRKLNLNSTRLYVSGRNIFTFSDYYDGYDPELTSDEGTYYPPTSIFTFGINISIK